jgi:tetratricopeptide (TPR) repeat protein
VLLVMGQAQGALAHFERAIKLRPGYASALEHRANALERLDRFAFGDPLYNLMMTARDEGRLADAASFACRLLTINPGDPDAQRVVAERRRVSASSWRRQKR